MAAGQAAENTARKRCSADDHLISTGRSFTSATASTMPMNSRPMTIGFGWEEPHCRCGDQNRRLVRKTLRMTSQLPR